jgi:hypothetical protein
MSENRPAIQKRTKKKGVKCSKIQKEGDFLVSTSILNINTLNRVQESSPMFLGIKEK